MKGKKTTNKTLEIGNIYLIFTKNTQTAALKDYAHMCVHNHNCQITISITIREHSEKSSKLAQADDVVIITKKNCLCFSVAQ